VTPTPVAVLLVCGPRGQHVERALRSVLGQTLPPQDTFVLDEGPVDLRTRQALARIEEAGHRVVASGDGSPAAARNLSILSSTAPLIAVVDAADVLEDGWLAWASARFDQIPDLSFLRRIGKGRSDSLPRATEIAPSEQTGHPEESCDRVILRRQMFHVLGGFDEDLGPCDWIDFWLRAAEMGLRGEVESGSGLTVASTPPYGYLDPGDAPIECMERLYRKHLAGLTEHHEPILVYKEQLLLAERARHEQLSEHRAHLERDADRLQRELTGLADELRQAGRQRVDLGDLRRTTPISPIWGLDRGIPLDRHYIHAFLNRHRLDIKGRVLEIKDPGYTRWFGDDRVSVADVLDVDPGNQRATVLADLTRADAIADNTYDCFILTQTLGFIYDVPAALRHACRILKPGGVLLCTLPAIGRISYEEGLDGDYWRFTEASVRRLFSEAFPLASFEMTGFGNVLSSVAFLYGLAPTELTEPELDVVDPYFPVVYGIRALKPIGARG
jgi:SAM-dependent methyltransferase